MCNMLQGFEKEEGEGLSKKKLGVLYVQKGELALFVEARMGTN